MKYMLIMRVSDEAMAESQNVDFDQILDSMGQYNDDLVSAGVLLAAEGLDDASKGVVVDYTSQPPVVTDGPYGETKELFNGFWILDVASMQEAVEWAKRAPLGGNGTKMEIRRVPSIDEFPQDNKWVQKEREWRGVHRPAVSEAREAVATLWRMESARIVGGLARYAGDFALAEDVAQEALAEALVSWPRDGVPRDPSAWLMTVGRRRAIDAFRRRAALDDRYAALAANLGEGGAASGSPMPPKEAEAGDLLWDPDRIDDDVLALMFIACHPLLSPEAQVALTLRVVGGLTSDEIARAFLVPTATIQARITRAKKTLSAAQVRFEIPPPDERRVRLGSVLSVIYVIFTEGSTATSGDDLIRPDLAHEAVRLARVLSRLVPDDPEAHGLLALLELTAARFPARTGPDGEPVLLADQDRDRWDVAAVRRGRAALAHAGRVGRGLGAYGVQAAIAECHAVAPSVRETDWDQIVVLYEALGRLAPSPVVELNRAVAVSMASGPAAALGVVDDLAGRGELGTSHLLPSVRGELLTRLGRTEEARAALTLAIERCGNARERAVLERKLRDLG